MQRRELSLFVGSDYNNVAVKVAWAAQDAPKLCLLGRFFNYNHSNECAPTSYLQFGRTTYTGLPDPGVVAR